MRRTKTPMLAAIAVAALGAFGCLAALAGLRPGAALTQTARAQDGPELQEAYRLSGTWDGRLGQGAPGSVLFPAGIAVTDDAVVLVDRGNHRLQRFGTNGSFVAAWGQRGEDREDFDDPRDVAVDGGLVYVTDHGNARVVVRDLDGNVVDIWSSDDLPEPWGIAARSGGVYVTDRSRGQVVLLRDGAVVSRFAGLTDPMGIDIGSDGRVYVADRAASRIRFFSADGAPSGELVTNLPPTDVAVDVLGDLYVQSAGAILWYPAGAATSRQAMYYDGMQGVALHTRHGVYATVARTDVRLAPSFHGVVRYRWQPADGLPQAEWRLRGFPPGRMHRPHAVEAGPSGTIWLLDGWPRVQGFAPDGRPVVQVVPETTTGIVPVDLAESPSGELLIGETRRIVRVSRTGAITQAVRLAMGTTNYWLTGLDWREGLPRVSMLDSALLAVRDYGVTRTLQPIGGWPLAPGEQWSLFWDLAVDDASAPDRVYLASRGTRQVWVMENGRRAAAWTVDGIPARLDVGPEGHLFVLTAEGLVYKYDRGGDVIAAWDAGAFSAGASEVVDLTVDEAGRVYTVDRAADTVRVWEVDPDATPEPPASRPGACRLRADKRAAPEALRLGQTVTVELSVGGECPTSKPRADIVLAIDRSGSMNAHNQITATREAAIEFIDAIDLARDRVGIVAFNNSAEVLQPLTGDRDAAVRAVQGLTAIGGTSLADAFRVSTAELFGPNARDDTQAVIVLLTDGRDREPDDALDASAAAQQLGTRVFTIGFGDVDPMVMVLAASTPEQHYYAPDTTTLSDIYRDIAQRITASVLARTMTVIDELPPDMRYVPGSARPAATYDAGARTLTWQLADIPFDGITLAFELEPTVLGRRPTNVEARATYVDGLNSDGRLRFPIPEIEVLSLEPTATPTSTQFPTPTPRPTRTPLPPEPLYLPIAVRQHCRDEEVHADIALVMDTSSSMEQPSVEGGPTKLEVAVAAGRTFVGLLSFPGDQAAIVRFDSEASVEQTLTGDLSALETALDGLEPGQGTRIDLGIERAHRELTSERHAEGNNQVLVLLTDGRNTGVEDAVVLERAEEARQAGLLLYTIGLGEDVDAALLAEVSSGEGYAFLAPTTDELEQIYRQIAYTIACPNLTWP